MPNPIENCKVLALESEDLVVDWRKGAKRTKTQLSILCKLEVASHQHVGDGFEVDLAGVSREVEHAVVFEFRAVPIEQDVRTSNFVPAWQEDSSS